MATTDNTQVDVNIESKDESQVQSKSCLSSKTAKILIVSAMVLVVTAIVAVVIVVVLNNKDDGDDDSDYVSLLGTGAIVVNGLECAAIGKRIFQRNGNVVDAAIAIQLCEGVSVPQSTGVGGGFIMTLYIRETNTVEVINARERAPAAATADMFVGDPDLSLQGGLAAAVPGEIRGFWEVHQKYGKLPWSELFEPAIDLCINGHEVTPHLARSLQSYKSRILASSSLSEIFINPATGDVWEAGQTMYRPQLGATFRAIAQNGPDALYNGTLTQGFVDDVQSMGGIITAEDMANYRPTWDEPVVSTFLNDYTVYTPPPPASGALATFMLNVMDEFINSEESALNYHRIIETFKYAYAKRTELADIVYEPSVEEVFQNLTNIDYADYIRSIIDDSKTNNTYEYYGANFANIEDHGTAHTSLIAPNGDAISMTSTINFVFGNRNRSVSTGIILNNEMDDFSTPGTINGFGVPASPANYVKPFKRPMSSMTPLIIINKHGDVEMVAGGAGGTKITTLTVFAILRHFVFKDDYNTAMDTLRIHHQLAPMYVEYEQGFNADIISGLEEKGHETHEIPLDEGFAALTFIGKENNNYTAVYDKRRFGNTEVFGMSYE